MVNPVYGLTLKGGVKYTVESAREEAFRNIEYEISMEPHKKYLTDPGYTPGEGGKKPKISKRGRYVNYFSDGTYGVRYYANWKYIYVYNNNGKLKWRFSSMNANKLRIEIEDTLSQIEDIEQYYNNNELTDEEEKKLVIHYRLLALFLSLASRELFTRTFTLKEINII